MTDSRITTGAKFALAVLVGAACGLFPFAVSAAGAASAGSASEQSAPTVYTCSMHPQVMQTKPGNCPICGMKLVPLRQQPAGRGGAAGADQAHQGTTAGAATGAVTGEDQGGVERKILYWWDPMMNPPYISDRPGKSPMGMDLVPVYEDEARGGLEITIDPRVTQNMGVRVAEVARGPIATTFRAVGYLKAAQSNEFDVTSRIAGYIEHLYANTEGMLVKQGEALADLYSPELLVAQEEALAAKRALDRLEPGADAGLRLESEGLLEDAKRKLLLWGIAEQDIDRVLESGKAGQVMPLRSPATGFVTDKNVAQGSAVAPGERLLRIVDQSTVWLDAQVFESQMSLVAVGQEAQATVQGLPGRKFSGRVLFVSPQIDPEARTLAARIAFPNGDLALKPGMYATVEITVEAGRDALQIPREALIDTGKRQVVFVALGEGRFAPREVRAGVETGDGKVQILEGLAPGETVVTSGQFLMDTESRTREAIQKMTDQGLLASAPAAETEGKGQAAPSERPAEVGSEEADAILVPYLAAARSLAADTPIAGADVQALVKSAEALAAKAGGGPLEPVAAGILEASRSLDLPAIADQRKQFKLLSENVIHLVDHVAPSNAIGARLYVVHCSMYPGEWLQAASEIANPFFGKSMLECGSIKRTIDLAGSE
jgi:multidrug efflux pump subunit AcrA (membrane-fusion protein)